MLSYSAASLTHLFAVEDLSDLALSRLQVNPPWVLNGLYHLTSLKSLKLAVAMHRPHPAKEVSVLVEADRLPATLEELTVWAPFRPSCEISFGSVPALQLSHLHTVELTGVRMVHGGQSATTSTTAYC
jgi:hypothetical protein